jgi:hypothetical protein
MAPGSAAVFIPQSSTCIVCSSSLRFFVSLFSGATGSPRSQGESLEEPSAEFRVKLGALFRMRFARRNQRSLNLARQEGFT